MGKLTQVRENILAPHAKVHSSDWQVDVPLGQQVHHESLYSVGVHHLTDAVFVHSERTICPILKASFPPLHNTKLNMCMRKTLHIRGSPEIEHYRRTGFNCVV